MPKTTCSAYAHVLLRADVHFATSLRLPRQTEVQGLRATMRDARGCLTQLDEGCSVPRSG